MQALAWALNTAKKTDTLAALAELPFKWRRQTMNKLKVRIEYMKNKAEARDSEGKGWVLFYLGRSFCGGDI